MFEFKIASKDDRNIPIWFLVLLIAVLIGLFFVGSLPLVLVPNSLKVSDEVSFCLKSTVFHRK